MSIPFFFFNDTATTEIYTLSLHDALPIYRAPHVEQDAEPPMHQLGPALLPAVPAVVVEVEGERLEEEERHVQPRSEEHTSELQSPCNLVCRLLLEKKK